MEAITDPKISNVTVMKSARIGWTTIVGLALTHYIKYDPCPILIVQPTKEEAKEYSKDTIAPLLSNTPAIKNLIYDSQEKGGNTILHKLFPGGILYIIGANNTTGFRRKTIRITLCDELDGWAATTPEGDQEDLLDKRMEDFWDSKNLKGSTPTVKGESRIEQSYELSDKRRCYVPCPHCNNQQYLKFGGKDVDFGLKWPSKDRLNETYYLCEFCREKIQHHQKFEMVKRCEWIPEKESKDHAGFHIWAAYSFTPKACWENLAIAFLKTNKIPDKLMVFVNTWLGETFEMKGEQIEEDPLLDRRENYGDIVPMGAVVLVMSVDVQGNRLEALILGYGVGQEVWFVEHKILIGSPDETKVWNDLDKLIQVVWPHESGAKLPISLTVIDHGYKSKIVEDFVKPRQKRQVFAMKGDGKEGKAFVSGVSLTKLGKNKFSPIIVGSTAAKDFLAGRLSLTQPGPGYIHLNEKFTKNMIGQLVSEKSIPILKGGEKKGGEKKGHKWVLKTSGSRNEMWDLFYYNLAAFSIMTGTSDEEMEARVKGMKGEAAPQQRRVIKRR